jgi:serine/threonine protein kinase
MSYSFQSPQKNAMQYSNNINGYKLEQVLGRGGFGVVYKATSLAKSTAGKQVAIKLAGIRLILDKQSSNESAAFDKTSCE